MESKLDFLNTIDVSFRMLYAIIMLSNFIVKSLNNETYYNESE